MKTLGILGGMGPLASAEFLSTLYQLNITDPEQDSPSCILLSDPTIPDRTQAILNGGIEALAARLSRALQDLASLGADRIVIACVTAHHHVLPHVPEPLRLKVVSLIDLVIDEVLSFPQPYLLLTTTGTRTARIFEQHGRWREIEPWVIRPDEKEQRELHEQLYLLKKGEPGEGLATWIDGLASRHAGEGIIFGCTELHLLHRPLARSHARVLSKRIVDPLLIAARNLRSLLEF
jgi:aspartate racemase